MLGKPIKFCIINLVLFFGVLTLFGFNASLWVMAAMMAFIILYNASRIGVLNSMVLAIIYGMVFDSDFFSFTYYKFRLWYFLLLIVAYCKLIVSLHKSTILCKRVSLERMFVYSCAMCLFLLSAVYLLFEPFTAKLYNIKYWLFYVLAIIVLYRFFKNFPRHHVKLFDYLISIATFVAVWGIIQFFFNTRGVPNYMYDYYNIRPSAFFSETTWHAEYLVFGLFLILLRISTTHKYRLIVLIPLFIAGIVLSATRNAYIGLFILAAFGILYLLIEQRVSTKFIFNRYFAAAVLAGLTIAVVFREHFTTYIDFIISKFTLSDASGQGRVQAFKMSVEDIKTSPIFGQGFDWSGTGTGTGTSVGAKSFNLFFMILHIFGLVGFVPFLFLIIGFYLRTIRRYFIWRSAFSRYSLIMFTTFLAMAMFAPIHQYPFGMYVIALSIFLSKLGAKWRKTYFSSCYNLKQVAAIEFS